ncbi:Gfo/Idh/MocA family protein [Acidomonas methanolica]|uniref:Gfo/Idh/MocA family protein n=1 Tax=Acidomonas methanolica TaxID=437 RepID=UPI00211A970A|nr:Gfo/Idh/MocA family oxidoreductase [Acidomonas methanolica]MCQ9156887.1 Gfo/Idh/MocA family oxidoreductase [Acidomonas methanolica]
MTASRFRIGIVGLEPGRSWAARAHVPALRALSDSFEIAGAANTSLESAQRAAAEIGLPKAYTNVAELVADAEVDIVAVTVKVSHHLEIAKAAIEAGKHVYCEWPLGNGLAEAEEIAALAKAKGVLGVVGTQARVAPEIQYLKQLIVDGFVGEVLSTTLVARGGGWGGIVPDKKNGAYLLDNASGATMLTIPVGHTLAGLTEVLGPIAQLSSVLATRRTAAVVAGTGETLPVTTADQVLVSGVLVSGAPISVHYVGGMPRDGAGLLWEINGTQGDIRVMGPFGHAQLVPLTIEAARGDEKAFQRLEVPASYLGGLPSDPAHGNVARNYARMARDLRDGTRTAPTFDDAVLLHRVIAAIETAATHSIEP